MNRLNKITLTIIASSLVGAIPLMAQQKRISPHETISKTINDGLVMVVYGRPYLKDPKSGETRKIWGGLVPFGKVWRTGADEATSARHRKTADLRRNHDSGRERIRCSPLPTEDGSAKLIISKQLGEWGAYTYDEKQDLARIDLKKETAHRARGRVHDGASIKTAAGGVLKLMWESTGYSVPFTVKK